MFIAPSSHLSSTASKCRPHIWRHYGRLRLFVLLSPFANLQDLRNVQGMSCFGGHLLYLLEVSIMSNILMGKRNNAVHNEEYAVMWNQLGICTRWEVFKFRVSCVLVVLLHNVSYWVCVNRAYMFLPDLPLLTFLTTVLPHFDHYSCYFDWFFFLTVLNVYS